MFPFPICNVAVLSSLHYGKPEQQHLLEHLSYELLRTYTHFPSAVISIQVWGATCSIQEGDCFLKTKTLRLFQDLPSSVEKICVVPPESSTVIEGPLSTRRQAQSFSSLYSRFHTFTLKVVWRSSRTVNSIQICTSTHWKRCILSTTRRDGRRRMNCAERLVKNKKLSHDRLAASSESKTTVLSQHRCKSPLTLCRYAASSCGCNWRW